MSDSLVRAAAAAFKKEQYEEALSMYEKAAELYGAHNFQANILLCRKRLTTKAKKRTEGETSAPGSETRVARVDRKSLSSYSREELLALAKTLPLSNGSALLRKIPLRVGIITDTFMYNFYKDVFSEIHYLSPTNYEKIMESVSFDFIIYVTCWQGMRNEEWRGVKFRAQPAGALDDILKRARTDNVKLVFQSIEDPSNFDYFLPIAKKFDYIFTSDTESVDRYKNECGHERVFYGEYGVNPKINNPIGCRRHIIEGAFFAGSWAGRYKERCEDMETIFDSILASGGELLIADRNYGSKADELQYPDRFKSAVTQPIEHELLQLVHKIFRHNLNFNSIKDSPTMCAMRVYELQAMGVGILSNYARSVFNKFPEVRLIPWRMDLSCEFNEEQSLEEYRLNMAMLRNVMKSKTVHDVAQRMIESIGFDGNNQIQPKICVIVEGNSPQALRNISRQRYQGCVKANVSDVDTKEKWDTFARVNSITHFTWFSDADEYEENYLDDLINAFKYTNSRYVTRLAWFDGASFHAGTQHDYVEDVGGKARTLFAASEFSPVQYLHLGLHERVSGVPGGYAIDPFELNYRRYARLTRGVAAISAPKLSVIVPVYNNGRFLSAKCINSLKRNRVWSEMEVLLIDDGSTDEETLELLDHLVEENANVRAFFFKDGGSGSASRPRNKGIELAKAPLISFLDPDNEISPFGYDVLLQLYEEAIQDGGVDFVSGYHVKVEAQATPIGKHTAQRLWIVEDLKKKFLESGKFPVIPTQPAVIARRLFESGELRFVEKAAGQDTLFGWALLCHAKAGAFTDAAYLIYYAQRAGSIVNQVDAGYFEKKLILEKAQAAALARYGVLDAYLHHGFDRFMRNWYIPKLASVHDAHERSRCVQILGEITKLYGRDLSAYDGVLH